MDEMTLEQRRAIAIAQARMRAAEAEQTQTANQQSKFPVSLGQSGFPAAMSEVLSGASGTDKALAAFGSGARDIYEGAKQMLGMGDPVAIQGNRMIRNAAPVSAFAGDVGMFVPTSFIPGLNTMTGTAALGGAYGMLQPTDTTKNRALNAVLGTTGAVGGKYIGDKVVNKVGQWLANKDAANTARRGENAVVDQTLNDANRAGYVFPPTAMNRKSILEAISGQFKTQQEASWRNQAITNNLARPELGLNPNEPITEDAFKAYFNQMGKPYADVAGLSDEASTKLGILKDARYNANLQSKYYGMSGNPDALTQAKTYQSLADQMETDLENIAIAKGQPELVNKLQEARTNIAKAHSYKDATRFSTGDINAAEIAKDYRAGMQGTGPKLSGNLALIGKIADARPESLRMRGFAPNPNTALDTGVATISAASSGNPGHFLASGIPLLRGPIRNYLLSPSMQEAMRPRPSDYATGLTPEFIKWLLSNPSAQASYPGIGYGLLSNQNNYGSE